ncbi:MAG: glycosyltransferase family 1 protein [Kiritimatiellia bacterium]|nr:glycosyltransferase family 1 protein [Kiritimatiellia bacterium]
MTRKLRVCIIADAVDEAYAGVSTYATELIPRLAPLAPDMEFTFLHSRPNPFFSGQAEIILPVHRSSPLRVLFRKFLRTPSALRKGGFDLIHDLFHFPPFAFQDFPCTKIVTLHDLTPLIHPEWHTASTVLAHQLFMPRVCRRAHRIIADSRATADDIERFYRVGAERLRVVPLAPKQMPRIERSASASSRPSVLFVGTLEPRKNISLLVDAFERLRSGGQDAELVLAGRAGWRTGAIFERMSSSVFRADIRHVRNADDHQLAALYASAAVLVFPSLYEGFGLPVLEAMQMGCPVIASNRSSLPEVAGGAALLVDPEDADALAKSMATILQNPAEAARLAQAGSRRAQEFSWERTARETLAVYREFARRGADPCL